MRFAIVNGASEALSEIGLAGLLMQHNEWDRATALVALASEPRYKYRPDFWAYEELAEVYNNLGADMWREAVEIEAVNAREAFASYVASKVTFERPVMLSLSTIEPGDYDYHPDTFAFGSVEQLVSFIAEDDRPLNELVSEVTDWEGNELVPDIFYTITVDPSMAADYYK